MTNKESHSEASEWLSFCLYLPPLKVGVLNVDLVGVGEGYLRGWLFQSVFAKYALAVPNFR